MATNWTRAHRSRDKKEILEMDWTYTEERRWKHRQSCVGMEPTGETEDRAPTQSWSRTRMAELKAKNITWTECKKTAKNRTRWKALVEDICST